MSEITRKNAYVATFYSNNYGSTLQAFSLQCAIKECGGNPKVLRAVEPSSQQKTNFIFRVFKALWVYFKPEKHYGVLKKIRQYRERKLFAEKRKKINDFCSRNISFEDVDVANYTPKYAPDGCVFIAGSDQIWNIIDREIASLYKFSFLNGTQYKKYSFAASVGMESLTEEQKNYYIRTLSDFDTISFRENATISTFESSPLKNKIRQDVDPTLLHNGEFWNGYATDSLSEEPYIFIYMLRPDKRIFSMAKSLANKHGLKIYYTGIYAYKESGITTVTNAGVEEFLSFIKNAEYIITNSFHGTCFSMLFHKRFVSVKITSTGERASSLLNHVGLSSHLIENEEGMVKIEEDINYNDVEERLNELRQSSLYYLKTIIN